MFNTLLNPTEIIYYTGISKEFPKCSLRLISNIEYYEFKNCLGISFYNQLKDLKINYEGYTNYANNVTYNVGDIVNYEGILYQNIEMCINKIPKDDTYWQLAPKFSSNCIEFLWCNYLAEYLSWRVIFDRLPFIHTQIKAEGLIKPVGSTFETAATRDYENIAKAILRSAERSFENMDYFIRNNNSSECYNLYKGLGLDCCKECGEQTKNCICDECLISKSDGYEYSIG